MVKFSEDPGQSGVTPTPSASDGGQPVGASPRGSLCALCTDPAKSVRGVRSSSCVPFLVPHFFFDDLIIPKG